MRTVVFSNEAVAKAVNEKFVCAWTNTSPQTRFRDGQWSKLPQRFYETYSIGNGVTNITSIFARPDGTVLSAVPGYLDVAAFEAEMKFALEARDKDADALAAEHREQAGVRRGPFAGRAHQRLSKSALTLDRITRETFRDFAPDG